MKSQLEIPVLWGVNIIAVNTHEILSITALTLSAIYTGLKIISWFKNQKNKKENDSE